MRSAAYIYLKMGKRLWLTWLKTQHGRLTWKKNRVTKLLELPHQQTPGGLYSAQYSAVQGPIDA